MSKDCVLQVKVTSNIDALKELLTKAVSQASELSTTINQLNDFQLEIHTEFFNEQKEKADHEVQVQEQHNEVKIHLDGKAIAQIATRDTFSKDQS